MAAGVLLWAAPGSGVAQQAGAPAAAAPAAKPPVVPGLVVREVPMKDAHSAQSMKDRLDAMKAGGVFKEMIAGPAPNIIITKEIQFMVAGNVLLVIGEPEKVERHVDSIRLMAYMAERPRAHLEMNLRVVQITGPANAEVTQLSEAVQALVQSQREEVVRTFADLNEYLKRRLADANAPTVQLVNATQGLLPTLGKPERTPTVPETLLMLMLDRLGRRLSPSRVPDHTGASAAALAAAEQSEATREDLLRLPRTIAHLLAEPHHEPAEVMEQIRPDLEAWIDRVQQLKDRFHQYGVQLEKAKNPAAVAQLKESMALPDGGVPDWLAVRLTRSLEVTEHAFPSLTREHAQRTVQEFERRFDVALKRGQQILSQLDQLASAHQSANDDNRDRVDGKIVEALVGLKALANQLAPPPMALFDAVSDVVESVSPSAEQVVKMFHDYTIERRKLDALLAGTENAPQVNYAKLQSLEAALNLWLRRAAEALGHTLEQQFYSQYTNELRMLANKSLGRSSNRNLLDTSSIYAVPDVARDQILSGGSVNIFLSNSVSLQFAPDTINSVSAQVESSMPSRRTLPERLQLANGASQQISALKSAMPGLQLDPAELVGSLLAGGDPVPVRGGMSFSATPSIGYDAGTVSLVLSTNQTLEPTSDKVTDRVANHSISNATITALSYEPMVLSTLASNLNYYEEVGGIPVLRKVPVVKELLNEVPVKPIRTEKRQRGIVQSSVVILEPMVIPTIEDLVRYQSGYRTAE